MAVDFADLQDAGRALAQVVGDAADLTFDGVLAVGEPGMSVARSMIASWPEAAVDLVLLGIARTDEDVVVGPIDEESVRGRRVLVVDAGVETGRSAMMVAAALKAAGVAAMSLAVPVCPRQAEPMLLRAYGQVVAVVRPLGRRSLTWHYGSMDLTH